MSSNRYLALFFIYLHNNPIQDAMESLKTKTTITLDEVTKWYNYIIKKRYNKYYIIWIAFIVLFSIIGNYVLAAWIAIVLLLFPLFLHWSIKRMAKKHLQSNKFVQNETFIYEFHKEHFMISQKQSYVEIAYADLYDIVETKENFYLMPHNTASYIIIKSNCSIELIEFIENIKDHLKNGK